MYIIVKHIKQKNGKELPVILVDTHEEVLEFDKEDDANKTKTLFEINSDSGHRYEVKKI